MARREKKARTKTRPLPAVRAASPRRELVGLTGRSGAVASTLATGTALGMATGGLAPAASAAAAAGVMGLFGAKVKGRTLGEWITLRRNVAKLPEQAALFERDKVGIIFDGRTASVVVEIFPRPWQLTTITSAGLSEAPVVSVDQLRRQLTQYDIHCSRITAICAGFKFAARGDAAEVLNTLIGPVSAPLGGTTAIVVSVDLDAETLVAAYRRAPLDRKSKEPSLPGGLCRTVTIAARRVCNALAESGFGGELMGPHRVREFHDAALAQLAAPLSAPGWSLCGSANGVHTRTYTPARGHWNASSAAAWHHLQSHRQYTTLTLTPAGDGGQALAQPVITYLVNRDEVLSRSTGYGLAPAVGQQVAGAVQALPITAQVPLRTAGALIDDTHQLGFGIPAGGAGMFVGNRADKTRVFVATPPAEDPLWLVGPQLFAMQMVARLSTQDLRIAVMIDDPSWQRMVQHRNTATLTTGTLGSVPAEVVVTTPPWWERNRELCSGKAVILVTGDDPGQLAANSLVVTPGADGTAKVAVNVDKLHTEVNWELTPLERRTMLGEVDADGVYPQEQAQLRLSDRAQLPVLPPPPKPAPAPAPPPLEELPTTVQISDLKLANPQRGELAPVAVEYASVAAPRETAGIHFASKVDFTHVERLTPVPEPVVIPTLESVGSLPERELPPLRWAKKAQLTPPGRHRRDEEAHGGDSGA